MIEQGIYISQVENNEVENGYIKNRNKSGQCTVEENVHEIVIMNFGMMIEYAIQHQSPRKDQPQEHLEYTANPYASGIHNQDQKETTE